MISIHFGTDCIVDTKELAQLALFATTRLRNSRQSKSNATATATAGATGSLNIFGHEGAGHSFVRSLRASGALVGLLHQVCCAHPAAKPAGMPCTDIMESLRKNTVIADYITLCKLHRWLSVCENGCLDPAVCACCDIETETETETETDIRITESPT
jgi:hypothetical protein